MRKKQFKAESKRLMDMMVNSIYTNKEIFLREIISNASDAIDKLAFLSLTDDKVGLSRSDFQITLNVDKENRVLTVSDNGIGMNADELENNLGIIAHSGSRAFSQENADADLSDTEIIGQFGVGFYSAFVVADRVTVLTRRAGAAPETGVKWTSDGRGEYTLEDADLPERGTT
ncbi:MAG: ATP-binding protein, partial [Clostridia bacterium]|nr:ATP-binding protein [Clostridia bacterium]